MVNFIKINHVCKKTLTLILKINGIMIYIRGDTSEILCTFQQI